MTDTQVDMTALAVYSTNPSLALNLNNLQNSILEAAEANVDATMGQGFTMLERRSMIYGEALKLTNGLDLAAMLTRYAFIRVIRDEGLYTVYPQAATDASPTLDNMVKFFGVSTTELSKIIDLCEIIFPYLQSIGMEIPVVWEAIGKSNMRELTPVLKALITNEASATGSVRDTVERLLQDVYATAEVSETEITEEEARAEAIEQLIDLGQNVSNRELQRHLRPNRTNPVEGTAFTLNGQQFFISSMDDEQLTMMERVMGGHLDLHRTNIDGAPEELPVRVPEVSWLINALGGRS